ncbi:MAG: tRNA lysidine(34) synthetase TilS [Planctomycetes bacterium]|nr:tRNA lysidine(34) synthetase TilS [Planctomycetota bacterium]
MLSAEDCDPAALPPPGSALLVAVSGGADSLALWDCLACAGRWRVAAWHLDHGLRAESAADAAAVVGHGRRLLAEGRPPLAVLVERHDIAAAARAWRVGLEEAGRRQRYARLAAVAAALGAGQVATAHHRDDQAETVLMNLLRGAGPAGWCGIAVRRPLVFGVELVRPALGLARQRLREHAVERALGWCEDASNGDLRFCRNRVRLEVLPAFEQGCPGFTERLLAQAAAERQAHQPVGAGAQRTLAQAWSGDEVELAALEGLPAAEQRELLACWLRRLGIEVDRARLRRLDDLVQGASGRELRLGPWLLCREPGRVRCVRATC